MTTNQQLKAHCEDVIANQQEHLDWVVDIARVALASLEAVPVKYGLRFRNSHGTLDKEISSNCLFGTFGQASNYGKGGYYVTKEGGGYKWVKDSALDHEVVPFYTAPPAPELKPIEMSDIRKWETALATDRITSRKVDDLADAVRASGYEVKS